jgi:hypothetical protein
VILSLPTKANLAFTVIKILGLTVPIKCRTAEPLSLNLSDELGATELLLSGAHFTGVTSFSTVKCEGSQGTLDGALLSALFSGPGNPYSLSIAPPG